MLSKAGRREGFAVQSTFNISDVRFSENFYKHGKNFYKHFLPYIVPT